MDPERLTGQAKIRFLLLEIRFQKENIVPKILELYFFTGFTRSKKNNLNNFKHITLVECILLG